MRTYINAVPSSSALFALSNQLLAALVGVGATGWFVDVSSAENEFVVEPVVEGSDGTDGVFVLASFSVAEMVEEVKASFGL